MENNTSKIYLHIGFGRTSSTTMQNKIFPKIALIKNMDFIQGKSFRKRYNCASETEAIEKYKHIIEEKKIRNRNLIISDENLISLYSDTWSPHSYELSFENLKKNFDKDSNIIITIRKPSMWLRSVYSRFSDFSSNTEPEDFFILAKEFNEKININKKFIIDQFDLKTLIELYKSHFNNVFVIKFENIPSFEFVERIFNINDKEQLIELQKIYLSKKTKIGLNFYTYKINKFLEKIESKYKFILTKIIRIFSKDFFLNKILFNILPKKEIKLNLEKKNINLKKLDDSYDSIDEIQNKK